MKIKILLLSFALIASSSAFSVFKKHGSGDVGTGGMQIVNKMAFISSVIIEIIPENNIDITFTEDIGVVYAAIRNNTGTIVSQSKVNTASTGNLDFKIANLPKGSYILTVTNSQGAIVKIKRFAVD